MTNFTNNICSMRFAIFDFFEYRPGHSGGLCNSLKKDGIQCCHNGGEYGQPQINDDVNNKSITIVKSLFQEMSRLFPDETFDIGGDETGSTPPCT